MTDVNVGIAFSETEAVALKVFNSSRAASQRPELTAHSCETQTFRLARSCKGDGAAQEVGSKRTGCGHEAKVKWGPSVAERTGKRDMRMVC